MRLLLQQVPLFLMITLLVHLMLLLLLLLLVVLLPFLVLAGVIVLISNLTTRRPDERPPPSPLRPLCSLLCGQCSGRGASVPPISSLVASRAAPDLPTLLA